MKKLFCLAAGLFMVVIAGYAQIDTPANRRDTIPKIDTTKRIDSPPPRQLITVPPPKPNIPDTPDTSNVQLPVVNEISKRPAGGIEWKLDSGNRMELQILRHHPYFGFASEPTVLRSVKKSFGGKELLFYSMLGLLLIYALLRQAFPKYFNDLFRLFFRTTIKQRQIKEQLIQTPLPSLLLNGFFAVSAGLYISFLVEHYNMNPVNSFWLLFLYCVLGISAIYLVKFLGLKITGWVFSMKEAADAYIFIVFVINKMAGLLLLPFLILLAFSQGNIYSISLTLSFITIAGLLAYRFILTYTVVRNQVRVNPFQFFLYLCAFEIAPLLLVYKLLLNYFRIST